MFNTLNAATFMLPPYTVGVIQHPDPECANASNKRYVTANLSFATPGQATFSIEPLLVQSTFNVVSVACIWHAYCACELGYLQAVTQTSTFVGVLTACTITLSKVFGYYDWNESRLWGGLWGGQFVTACSLRL